VPGEVVKKGALGAALGSVTSFSSSYAASLLDKGKIHKNQLKSFLYKRLDVDNLSELFC
jgi:hypothetical protein